MSTRTTYKIVMFGQFYPISTRGAEYLLLCVLLYDHEIISKKELP